MKREAIYIGIDVAVPPKGQEWSVSYEDREVEKLVASLQGLELVAVMVEATGGLELALVAALAGSSLPVAVVNPARCVTSPSPMAKNDRLDAQGMVHFGEAVHPPMHPLGDADTQVFGAMLVN